jgi:adenylate cyclase
MRLFTSAAIIKKWPLKKNYALFIFLFCLSTFHLVGQDQKIADSLARIYRQNTVKDTARLKLLKKLSFNEERDYRRALQYAEELIRLAQLAGNEKYLCAGYFLKGTKERLLDSLDIALDAFFKSAAIAKELHDVRSEAKTTRRR